MSLETVERYKTLRLGVRTAAKRVIVSALSIVALYAVALFIEGVYDQRLYNFDTATQVAVSWVIGSIVFVTVALASYAILFRLEFGLRRNLESSDGVPVAELALHLRFEKLETETINEFKSPKREWGVFSGKQRWNFDLMPPQGGLYLYLREPALQGSGQWTYAPLRLPAGSWAKMDRSMRSNSTLSKKLKEAAKYSKRLLRPEGLHLAFARFNDGDLLVAFFSRDIGIELHRMTIADLDRVWVDAVRRDSNRPMESEV
jgi:hypothetical protein